ncbi:transglycosylase SLT domain-containing protein [Pandoraea sputorum]|uniref:transglycosylase SLT domain-containing protein n=1 Tax=Pandoraea sputorum TaxID=93222 RepID=UPI002AF6BEC2|nr:transglycosylase SLT domain-containing protein [Pandoraea sputorum]
MTRILCTVYKGAAAILIGLLGIGFSSTASADCWFKAGQQHNIDPLLLYSIAKVESSLNPKAFNRNRNGTYDVGLMQINSSHLPWLSKVGITRESLVTDSCTSVMVGAQILSGFIAQYGYTWEAVGAYNAGGRADRREHRQRYATKVWRHYVALKQAEKSRQPGRKLAARNRGS